MEQRACRRAGWEKSGCSACLHVILHSFPVSPIRSFSLLVMGRSRPLSAKTRRSARPLNFTESSHSVRGASRHPPSSQPSARRFGHLGTPQRATRSRPRTPALRPQQTSSSISASPGSQVGDSCGLVTGPARADRQGPRGDPSQHARISLLPAHCRRKPTVDPHDRTPNTWTRVIEMTIRKS